jgi:hypothetical protein
LGVKLQGKRLLGVPRHGWVHNIKMDLKEMECEGVDCVQLAQDIVQ